MATEGQSLQFLQLAKLHLKLTYPLFTTKINFNRSPTMFLIWLGWGKNNLNNITNENPTLIDTINKIKTNLKENAHKTPKKHPKTLSHSQITCIPSLFQTRDTDGTMLSEQAHLKELTDAIGNHKHLNYLDPITVWWGGDGYLLIDGHYRMEAYKHKDLLRTIPVKAFDGSIDQAIAHSAALNSKNSLPMRTQDRCNFAWKLVVVSGLSKKQIMEACSVSYGTVGFMRKTKNILINENQHTIAELSERNWRTAQDMLSGNQDLADFDHDAALEKRAKLYAKKIGKALHNRPHIDPEAFALSLRYLDDRLPMSLLASHQWSDLIWDLINTRNSISEHSDY